MSAKWEDQLEQAQASWERLCRALEATGKESLARTLHRDEIDLAEGLRHMSRIARLALSSRVENTDSLHPYLDRDLGTTLKMGGDNPNGLYTGCPLNGSDTFVFRGNRGSAGYLSMVAMRSHACMAAGLPVTGAGLYLDQLRTEADGSFELTVSPIRPAGAENWIETDEFTERLAIRQFFTDWDDVRPMDLSVENVTRGSEAKTHLTLDAICSKIDQSAAFFEGFVPIMQSEIRLQGERLNRFETDIGNPTSETGGVPGGNAVTARWHLEHDEALLVCVHPPDPCPYWDAQVGNVWYESWDYRHFFSGITCRQATAATDGSITIVVSDRDPGTVNWLEAARHREGHIAIRWQLSQGLLPIPSCEVVPVHEVAARSGLPRVTEGERLAQRRALRRSVEKRFRL